MMRFDQVRREFKKTLWGEELDNERFAAPLSKFIDLGFLHQYDGKKYQCHLCSKVFDESEILCLESGSVCASCNLKMGNS